MDTNLFHKIWVIESLREDDLKTGTRLVEDQLFQAQLRHAHLEIAHEKPGSKAEFLRVLNAIRDEALHQGTYPMIHLECHGCPRGLEMSGGEIITWDEMRLLLIQINHACRLNLTIVVAACNGAHLIKVATQLDRAPFYAAIGPTTEVKAGAIERDFGAFYATFFETLNGDQAVHALNHGKHGAERTYHFFSALGLFAKAYRTYHDNYCTGKGGRARREALLTQALDDPRIKGRGVNWTRRQVKERLGDHEHHFDRMKERFFFIDKFPENAERFPYSRDDILALVQSSIKDS